MARDMLLAAARLHDESAIFLVIQEAVRLGSIEAPGVGFIYKSCFKPLVERGYPKALYLEGQLCERQGKNEKALGLYEKLVAGNATESTGTEHDVDCGGAWIAISKLRALKGDRMGVEAAISTAAFQYDNPAAYYQLAKIFTNPSSAEYETLMLKAAASGEAKASHELGVLYFAQSQGKIPLNDRSTLEKQVTGTKSETEEDRLRREGRLATNSYAATEKRKQARQWFVLGADAQITGSQVYLAVLLHKLGKLEEGWQWLDSASSSKDYQAWIKIITFLAEHWNLAHSDFSRVDIEGLRRGLSVKTGLADDPPPG